MDPVSIALLALATLVKNPALGGGGLKQEETVRLIRVLVQLIQGGRKTAQALRAFADEITAMAAAGYQPAERDFKAFEDRLAAAMAVVEEAKARLEARTGEHDPGELETQIGQALDEADKPDPVESPALAALDSAAVDVASAPAEENTQDDTSNREATTDDSKPKSKRGRNR